jgi:bifunctional non-homologous end joining protein LigD
MKPMLPSLTFEPPEGSAWYYEVKYDGFRAILDWDENEIQLTSRNGKSLLSQFPEIRSYLLSHRKQFERLLPLQLDGELVVLENPYKANFSGIQVRGRLRSERKIKESANQAPCRLMVFDVLLLKGENLQNHPFHQRKEKLGIIFSQSELNLSPSAENSQLVQFVKAYHDFQKIWEKVVLYDGEGIVAKNKNSIWEEGKRSSQWLKFKNWKKVTCFITTFDKTNGYFSVGVFKENNPFRIGQVLFGLSPEEKQTLLKIMKQNQQNEDDRFIYMEPAICLEVKYLELYEDELREPHFDRFRFDLKPSDFTFEKFLSSKNNGTETVEITHPEKPLWEGFSIRKIDYIHYLRTVSQFMLPFLTNRLLTVIRYPHGMFGEPFYQKNCPDYAPELVATHFHEGISYIVCSNLDTLIWLGNQLAIEFHIPFQTIHTNGPSEIVFDLDPPSREHFHLAIKAALMIKDVLDQLKLISFVKTSGNKGLQVYIPLPDGRFSYDDTRLFTSFLADYLISKDPGSFTIERLKKNRGNRLYIDYVQHSEGKTIVAPYSLRGNEHAGAATPLFWEEVSENLDVRMFTMSTVLERIKRQMDPFKNYFLTKDIQPFEPVLTFLKNQKG